MYGPSPRKMLVRLIQSVRLVPLTCRRGIWQGILVLSWLPTVVCSQSCVADDSAKTDAKSSAETNEFRPLNKNKTVLLDAKGKRLLLKSQVVLREGLLEMLVCLKQTKEHESLLSVDAQAQMIHAGLLALGAHAGAPVRWQPEYQPATGQQIDIFFSWTDSEGKLRRVPAQSWVRHATRRYYVEKLENLPVGFRLPDDSELKWDSKHKELLWYGHMDEAQKNACLKLSSDKAFRKAIQSIFEQSQIRPMKNFWVFAGSQFLTDEKTGEKFYQAEAGDLICVANFASATLDLSINSSATNDDLMFEAYTENIPPVGTEVTVELIPVFKPSEKTP
jgi:hypothetical protein